MKGRLNFTLIQRILLMSYAAGLFCAPAFYAQDSGVVVHDAWVRVPLPSKTETVAYMVIENHSSQKRALVSASSDVAGVIELHQMRMDGKVMSMAPVPKIEIPARGKATLSPSGYHLMMFRLKQKPAVGDNVNIVLKLDDGTSMPVVATVKK
jgi:copper(I)-binding protein